MAENSIKQEKPKKKSLERFSKLFQKKPKKTSLTSSISAMSLSDPGLSRVPSQASSTHHLSVIQQSPVRMASLASRRTAPIPPVHRTDTDSTKSLSIKSNKSINLHLLKQQRQVLKDLTDQKQQYETEVSKLQDQLQKTQDKIQQRTHDMELLQANYQQHLKSMRCSDDDCTSISNKITHLKQSIQVLAAELLPHAEEASKQLATLWLNLGDAIVQLGNPLPPHRIQMLTEKFMMDVLVQNLNINLFPGLDCNAAFLDLQAWFDHNSDVKDQKYNTSLFSTQLRQELSMVVIKTRSTYPDIDQNWNKAVDKSWHHLYRGLQRVYPFLKKDQEYGDRLRQLVKDAIDVGIAIKGQEVPITAVDIREGVQAFDAQLMEEEDEKSSGTIAFCISPPFIVKVTDRYEPLVKGRVLCTPF
ncbi:hypothetical protein K501DRAFT_223436, partial [Backusella circina FSU 941]